MLDDRTGPARRWVRLDVHVTARLPEADARHAAGAWRTHGPTSAAGEEIGAALTAIELSRRVVAVREILYDAARATEAEARQALERLLARLLGADR